MPANPVAPVDASLASRMRRADPDRYFCALFAPAEARAALLCLAAFNHELARAQEVASEPGLAFIRLQWWREVVEGAARRHEVATPLAALLAGGLDPLPLLAMIEAREAQMEGPPADEAAFLARLRGGPGALCRAMGAVLGADGPVLARLETLGAAYGLAGSLRGLEAMAPRKLCPLPLDLLGQAGFAEHAVFTDAAAVRAALTPRLRALGAELLGAPAALGAGMPAGLVGVLARRDLRALPAAAVPRGAPDRIAVLWAAMRGRV